jgi:hypothetical protein
MSGAQRFRYALEPVLLTRRWELDALLLALAERNAAIVQQEALQEGVRASLAAAALQWEQTTAAGKSHSVDAFVLNNRYVGDMSRQARELAGQMAELVLRRDEAIDAVVLAKRAVEAAEQHRDDTQAQFVRQRLSGDFKVADDQWNTLQSGAVTHGD